MALLATAYDGNVPGPAVLKAGDQSWPVSGLVLIGRRDDRLGIEPGVDLTPLDPELSVSRRHAEASWNERDGMMVRDLHSGNGTFVENCRIEPDRWCAVGDGQTIRVGDVALTVTDSDAQHPRPSSEAKDDIAKILDRARVARVDPPGP